MGGELWNTKFEFLNLFELQVQDNSPGSEAGLEAFFDFIVAIGNTRLVSEIKMCFVGQKC